MDIATIFSLIVLALCVIMFSLMIIDRFSKSTWFCKVMGWHRVSGNSPRSFDGASIHSICDRCKKEVMQDSQGNWF